MQVATPKHAKRATRVAARAPLWLQTHNTGAGVRSFRTDLVFLGLAIGAMMLCYAWGGVQTVREALVHAVGLLATVLPQLAGGVLIGGLAQQLLGKDKIAALLGAQSGLRGLAIATAAGALTPGGPYMTFPIVVALWKAGAELGALVTYVVAWSLFGFSRLIVWELPLMGLDFTSARILVSLPLPLIAGLLARRLLRYEAFQFKPGDGA